MEKEEQMIIEFADASNVQIEYEITIPTVPFGNLKPKLKMNCSPENASENMSKFRQLLIHEWKQVNKSMKDKTK